MRWEMSNLCKLQKEKIKQIVLTCLALLLIIIGYFNFNYTGDAQEIIEVSARDNENTLGDVELVNTESVEEEFETDIVPNDEIEETIEANYVYEDNNYFQETKIERDRMYSEMIETYQNVISNQETPEDQKLVAAQEINNITKVKNEIMITENLIMNKGFENVVILANNGNIDVIIQSANLTKEDIAKIQNIVTREFNTEIKNVNISGQ